MDKNYRTKICADLALEIAKIIKSGQFPGDQLSPTCGKILTMLDTENEQEFMTLLLQFTSKWPQTISILESVQKQQNAAQNVEHMFTRNTQTVQT